MKILLAIRKFLSEMQLECHEELYNLRPDSQVNEIHRNWDYNENKK